MQDDLLQCSCESPKGGRAGTDSPAEQSQARPGRWMGSVWTLILEMLLLGIINVLFGALLMLILRWGTKQ